MLTAARGAVPGLAPGKPDVEYIAMDGMLNAVPLADAARVRLTDMPPSRRFKAREGAAEPARSWRSATGARHVGYESWLIAMNALRDPGITRAAARSPGGGAVRRAVAGC